MSFLNGFYNVVSHRVAILLLVLAALVGGVCFRDFLMDHYQRWSVFAKVEGFAVILAVILSQFSYGESVDSIGQQQKLLNSTRPANEKQKTTTEASAVTQQSTADTGDQFALRVALFWDQLFALVNFALFAIAFCTIPRPLWHILSIQSVLAFFALNNFLQKRIALKLQSLEIRHAAVMRAMDNHHWLFSENGPSVVGYCLVILLLSAFGLWHSAVLASDQVPYFTHLLEAVAAGVAGYQISLSTATYFLFHKFSSVRALDFPGFKPVCNDNQLMEYLRGIGPGWFLALVFGTFFASVGIVMSIRPLVPLL
jgi:hypothetical protein